jgi:hypothetical protein
MPVIGAGVTSSTGCRVEAFDVALPVGFFDFGLVLAPDLGPEAPFGEELDATRVSF